MLTNLSISNYALIKQLNLVPSEKLNTITGETGAGKSIMLGAMGLLLGKRADSKVLLNEAEKCVVEGEFSIVNYKLHQLFDELDLDYSDITIIRREIAVSGKSRAFINDTPVTLDVLKQLSVYLIDIHSQHETILLGSGDTQIQIIDFYAQNKFLFDDYKVKYESFKNIDEKLVELKNNQSNQTQELEFNKFLLKELEEVKLCSEEEYEKLENELKLIENSEEIKIALNQVSLAGINSDSSIISILEDVKVIIKSVSNYSSELEILKERIESASIELNDIFTEIEHKEQNIDFDAERIEEIRNNVDTINSLMHKHSVHSISDLIILKEELILKVNLVEQFDEKVSELENELKIAENELIILSDKLTNSRKSIFNKLKINVEHILKELGMPNATFEISISKKKFSKSGCDNIELLFSANKGVAPVTLKQAASGGEFSRLMFTIKYLLADKTALPTIIFDEIDTGISGEIAIKMGKMMNRMAENHQVLTITHLPQVAALGDKHYFVFKDDSEERTFSQIKELVGDQRELEIAKMISGDNPSQVAFENARELLSLYHSSR